MRERHGFYRKTYVLSLTDTFEHFRDVCMEHHGLNPVYCDTLPSFFFVHVHSLVSDALFKITCVEIHLVYDQPMYEMVEQG